MEHKVTSVIIVVYPCLFNTAAKYSIICFSVTSTGIDQCFYSLETNDVHSPTHWYFSKTLANPMTRLKMSEKRFKEALLGKKFRTCGRSTIARHYRLIGRKGGKVRRNTHSGEETKRIILPARRCMLLGKMDNRKAMKRSHSMHATHTIQRVNLQQKRFWWEERNHFVRLRISMKGLKTIRKYGLQKAAEKFGLDLKKKCLFAGSVLRDFNLRVMHIRATVSQKFVRLFD
ncbi:ribosomal protein RPL28 [Cardiosporidium cionae]|uniref:Large ribosomal subunit protein bL28c n=1 Tax=Cardiosporidium cionae TaxID=476202 RepID=A0ABQ7JF24_9APIC|nr:ribosomal protein RPL28 [Cardiosporidium cionae]|eukprot:KAF8822495.1 ribosomal protein RPL28 [Cardiosporidium cionae]